MYPHFWLPEDNLEIRCRHDYVMYDVWKQQGYLNTTEENVIHYGFIEKYIEDLGMKYNIKEIAFDKWGATQMVQNLEGMGFTVIQFGQGYRDMSPPSKEMFKLLMEGKMQHGGNPVLKWMAGNIVMRRDPVGNIKPDKDKSTEKIDGIVATIMALDRCIKNANTRGSIYDECKAFAIINSPIFAPAYLSFVNVKDFIYNNEIKNVFSDFLKKEGHFDIVHFHNIEGLSISTLYLKEDFSNTKFIYSLHNYHAFCPEVQLWDHKKSKSCYKKDTDENCINCMITHAPKEKLKQKMAMTYSLFKTCISKLHNYDFAINGVTSKSL